MEYYPSFFPETALALLQALLWSMACVLTGAALIALCVYVVLVCSEIFFSQPRSKTRRAKAPEWACRAPVIEETLDLSADETPILAVPEYLGKQEVRVNTSTGCAQMPTPVTAALQGVPNGL